MGAAGIDTALLRARTPHAFAHHYAATACSRSWRASHLLQQRLPTTSIASEPRAYAHSRCALRTHGALQHGGSIWAPPRHHGARHIAMARAALCCGAQQRRRASSMYAPLTSRRHRVSQHDADGRNVPLRRISAQHCCLALTYLVRKTRQAHTARWHRAASAPPCGIS